jgi:WD40 repeat protein
MGADCRTFLAACTLLLATSSAQGQPLLDLHGDPLPEGAVGRLGTIRLRHGDRISEMALLQDGKTLATLDESGYVLLSDIATGKRRGFFRASPEDGWESALSPDGKWAASANGWELCLFEVATGKLHHRHKAEIIVPKASYRTAVCFSGDGRIVAMANADGVHVHRWETSTGKRLDTLAFDARPTSQSPYMVSSPDGHILLRSTAGPRAAVWHVASDKKPFAFPPGAVFSPDGKLLAHVAGELWTQVVLRDTGTGKELHRLARDVSVWRLSFAPTENLLAISDEDGVTEVVDPRDMKSVCTLRGPKAGAEFEFVVTTDGRRLASAVHRFGAGVCGLVVWQLPDARPLFQTRVDDVDPGDVLRCALSRNGATLLVACGHRVRLWDIASGKERPSPGVNCAPIIGLGISADGRQIATADDAGTVVVWDRAQQRPRTRFQGDTTLYGALAFDARGKTLSSVSLWPAASHVAVWDVDGPAKPARRIDPPEEGMTALVTDGDTVAWRTQDGGVSLVGIADSREHGRIHVRADDKEPWRFSPRDPGAAHGLFTSDARCLVMYDSQGWVLLWDIASGKYYPVPEHGSCNYGDPVLSADGRLVARYGHDKEFDPERAIVCVCERATGQPCLRFRVPGPGPHYLAFAPDGRSIAVSSWDGTIVIMDAATGKLLRTLTRHRGPIQQLRFSADGTTLYSASNDTTVLIWDMRIVPARQPAAVDLAASWIDLAGDDAENAYRAVWAFVDAPKQAPAFFAARLKPSAADQAVQRLLADLNSDNFATRDAAYTTLSQLGGAIEPALREALKQAPSLETRRRIERLLAAMPLALPPMQPEELRQVRAVQALELIGTAEARAVLQGLAKGAPHTRQTREAQESLDRLSKRAGAIR